MKTEIDSVKQIICVLDHSVETLSPRITARLADARHKAVSALRLQTAAGTEANGGGTARLFGSYIHNRRTAMSAALVCSAVFAAFVLTQHFSGQEATGQGDAFLLASELPPTAYVDKGFDAWLEQTSQQQ